MVNSGETNDDVGDESFASHDEFFEYVLPDVYAPKKLVLPESCGSAEELGLFVTGHKDDFTENDWVRLERAVFPDKQYSAELVSDPMKDAQDKLRILDKFYTEHAIGREIISKKFGEYDWRRWWKRIKLD